MGYTYSDWKKNCRYRDKWQKLYLIIYYTSLLLVLILPGCIYILCNVGFQITRWFSNFFTRSSSITHLNIKRSLGLSWWTTLCSDTKDDYLSLVVMKLYVSCDGHLVTSLYWVMEIASQSASRSQTDQLHFFSMVKATASPGWRLNLPVPDHSNLKF